MNPLARRQFLSSVGGGLAGLAVPPRLHATADEILQLVPGNSLTPVSGAAAVAEDERFWRRVRQAFDMPRGIVNLDNGNISPASREALDALTRAMEAAQPFPVKRFEEVAESAAVAVVSGVAALLGVPTAELALTRNATEALDTVLLGYALQAGDEIVCSAHDYYAMRDAIAQRCRRDRVNVRVVRPSVPLKSEDALVAAYERELGPRSRLVLVTHPSNLTGQLAPVRRIADAAHRVGAAVVVDGAQSMALVPYTMAELDCDFYGASLHKWLMAPVGWGVLWIRPEQMDRTWPLIPPPSGTEGTMRRYMRYGTFPAPLLASVIPALVMHERVGFARKAARMRYLTQFWRERIERLPGARFYTTAEPSASCGLATVELPGADPARVEAYLWARERILVQAMDGGARAPEIKGIRVTPSIVTSPQELERFVSALARLVTRGSD